ncbi:Site-specific recombinase phage integrase family, partial [Trichostrongylus colubriformis]
MEKSIPLGGQKWAERPDLFAETPSKSHPAPRFRVGADLAREATELGIPFVGDVITKALQADRAPSTLSIYHSEMQKFITWKNGVNMQAIPLAKARNLYLAKCAYEGKQKALPVITAALNYFCGPLADKVDRDIQESLLEAEKRSAPPVTHRAKVDPQLLRKMVHQGIVSQDSNITQAATLALLQFKALLRISEVRGLKTQGLKRLNSVDWQVTVRKSKTDQYGAGSLCTIRLDKLEQELLTKYLNSLNNQVFLFQSASTGFPLSYSTLRDRLIALLKATNLQHLSITSHSFRGGAASLALDLGVDQIRVMQA